MIEIMALGGYNEVGKNMTAVRVDNEIIVIDMGLHLENYIRFTEDEDVYDGVSAKELMKVGAIPDDSKLLPWKDMVKAIIPTHAHLDHVGALVFLSNKYKCPILATPFTAEVLRTISRDEKIPLNNDIKVLNVNSIYHVSDKITIEFINMTHSTPHVVMVVVHTPYGCVLYANDFKFDNNPIIGKKPNYKKLEEIGKKGIKALIVDCTRAKESVKTPSETVAREMLRDVMLGTNSDGKCVIVTTFSSHIARLKSIVEYGRKMNRKIVFLGRSLAKYVDAAETIGLVKFSNKVEIVKFGSKIKKRLNQIMKSGKEKYLLVVTGHQGEPKSTLAKIASGEFKFKFDNEDLVIFSCTVIPSSVNIENRENLEKSLHSHNIRLFKDIHVSGHASREDLRDLLNLTKPMNIIPAHGDESMKLAMVDLALEKGYEKGKSIHLLNDGQIVSIK